MPLGRPDVYSFTFRDDPHDFLKGCPMSNAISNIAQLLKSMSPKLSSQRYAFATTDQQTANKLDCEPEMRFQEEEGVTLILREEDAIRLGLDHEFVCQRITLAVHSALEAVGFMAAISNKLKEVGVPCNVVAGYYHDHLFIPIDKVNTAMAALDELSA